MNLLPDRARRLLDELIDDEDLYVTKKFRAGTNPEIHVTRHEPHHP